MRVLLFRRIMTASKTQMLLRRAAAPRYGRDVRSAPTILKSGVIARLPRRLLAIAINWRNDLVRALSRPLRADSRVGAKQEKKDQERGEKGADASSVDVFSVCDPSSFRREGRRLLSLDLACQPAELCAQRHVRARARVYLVCVAPDQRSPRYPRQ